MQEPNKDENNQANRRIKTTIKYRICDFLVRKSVDIYLLSRVLM